MSRPCVFNCLGNFNSAAYGMLTTSTVTLNGCLIDLNVAQGNGGNAEGGGLSNVLGATATVTGSILTLNQADGGKKAGLGGGAYNDAT